MYKLITCMHYDAGNEYLARIGLAKMKMSFHIQVHPIFVGMNWMDLVQNMSRQPLAKNWMILIYRAGSQKLVTIDSVFSIGCLKKR